MIVLANMKAKWYRTMRENHFGILMLQVMVGRLQSISKDLLHSTGRPNSDCSALNQPPTFHKMAAQPTVATYVQSVKPFALLASSPKWLASIAAI